MKSRTIPGMAILVFLYLIPPKLAAQYQANDFKTGKKLVKNVLILPPEATLRKSGMKGSEMLIDEAQTLGSELSHMVGQILSDKGCNVLPDGFGSAALDRNPDLRYALSDLQTRYDKLRFLLKKQPKDVRKGRFSLGDEVVNFTEGAAADGLVFIRADGYVPTTGLKTFVVLTGMGVTYSHVSLDISIIDAQTGTILYFAKSGSSGNFVDSPGRMKDTLVKSFSDFRLQYPPKS